MAHIQKVEGKRGVRWRAFVKAHNRTFTKTFAKKQDAQRWTTELEAQLNAGTVVAPSARTVSDAIDRYMRDVLVRKAEGTRLNQAAQLKWWRHAIGDLKLDEVTPALLVEARDELSRGRSAATVNRYLAALSHVFTQCAGEWQWLRYHPMRGVVQRLKEPPGRVRYLDRDEIEDFLAACRQSSNSSLFPVVLIALSTGMRRGEILGLRWKDVSLERRLIVLSKTKNRERRGIPITEQVLESLMSLQRYTHTDLLFPSSTVPPKPLDIRAPFNRALTAAGIEEFRFHDLRHTCASYLAMNGASEREIAEVLGHKSLSMVKRYSHLSREHLRGVLEKMNDAIFERQ